MTEELKRYYSLLVKQEEKTANIYIYGDILSWPWLESDVSSYNLAQEIAALEDIDTLNVFINSYGGEVAEGLAIYNALRRHKATVRTHVDGFACSAASVVFMAGDERIMSNASLLFIHNAWLLTAGDQNQLRQDADDLEKINNATVQAYMNHIRIPEEQLRAMMDAETWISAKEALEWGFATAVVNPATTSKAAASVRQKLAAMIMQQKAGCLVPEPPKDTVDMETLAHRVKELMSRKESEKERPEDPGPVPKPEPEPQSKGLFSFLAALANRLEGVD